MRADRTWNACCLLAIACLAVSSGCRGASEKDFIPAADTAREALSAALTAWKDGQPHLTIKDRSPAVEVLIVDWRDGQQLSAFEILGAAPSDDPNQRFNVRLTLAGGAPREVVFVVIGKDPLKVANQQDWEKSMGM